MATLIVGAAPAWAALRALPRARPSFALGRWLAEAGKSSFLFAAGAVMAATDVMMLGALSSAEQTGLYGVAARFFMLMQLPALAASAAMSHEAARLHAAGDRAALSTLVRGTAARTALAALGLAALCTPIALRPDLVFGAGFAAATAPMLILIWTRAGEAVFGHPGSVIANAGGAGRAGLIVLGGAAVNAGLNAVLIPQFGAVGAACATAAAYLALTAVLAHAVWRRFGVICLPGRASLKKEPS
jgi:O-antigen/teichoic acid export membrane protein